ncbi:hypothetical protein CH330_05440 [candidate division WOR-3 bacterium JGI_Cruoil_03_51_56]|uniref:4Fe-4S ferredoxin-type domain-containing protein n=1 Tax=candidate division WOR-3 bacterium JGI_Cruoil_03_51_56 TaxID=1973747 RepID=A0A235BVA3_UNCW3|nr:MAG: hypothetical protein CH330_05440 [candidate division WOR-3 bacterium JGI_Cruoil_03_51_56]
MGQGMGLPCVWFVPPERSRACVGQILEESGFLRGLKAKKKVGIKVHFGEAGNSNHLDPELVRAAAVAVSYYGLQPVAIETTTLYRGKRQNALDYIKLAKDHGFGVENTLAPIEILDGQHGEKFYEVGFGSELVPHAKLASGLRRLRYIINMAHFKGHFVAGFGGVIKNLAMGLAAKAGKLEMHSYSKPFVDPEKCVSCGTCVEYCPYNAINFVQYVAKIGRGCTGCGGCLAVCPQGAIQIDWNVASETVQLKMVEYCRAVLLGRRVFHFNFALRITPNCDCYPQTEKPFMEDVGVFASFDPVACDQAAYDRIKPGLKELYPHLHPEVMLDAAEKTGLGNRQYKLVEL